MKSEMETQAALTPFEDHLRAVVEALEHPDYVVNVKCESRYSVRIFGADFTRELVRRATTAPALYEALAMIGAMLPIMPDPDALADDEAREVPLTWREVSQIKHALLKATPQVNEERE